MPTKIEWCDETLNPVKGLCPMACSYCYARRMYKRFKWNPKIRFNDEWWKEIPKNPSKIFIGSTIELFGDWIDWKWLASIFFTIQTYPQYTFIFLTKKPENLIKWSPFPDNVWVGISATDNYDFINRIGYLSIVKAKIKFISFEPLLQWDTFLSELTDYISLVNWIIIGQQTPVSKKTEPKIDWIKEIVHAADKVSISVFLKDNLKPLLIKTALNDNRFWADKRDNRGFESLHCELRQEFPKI